MKRRDQLVLAGIASLVVCFALYPFLSGLWATEQGDNVITPNQRHQTQEQLRRAVLLAQKEPKPAEFDQVNQYIDDRWGHMEKPEHLVSTESDGGRIIWDRELRVAIGPGGKKFYGRSASTHYLFEGPVMRRRDVDRSGATYATLQSSGEMSEAAARVPMERIPFSQAPEGLFGPEGPQPWRNQ